MSSADPSSADPSHRDVSSPAPSLGASDLRARVSSLRVYSTLTRTKSPFRPLDAPRVRMYLCGPTVYKSPHVGHTVGPIVFDVVKRYLTRLGYDVTWVVNITDVEDKLIDAAARMGRPVDEVARQYEAEYRDVLRDLGITSVDHFPRASEHIAEIIDLCRTLIDRGHAYAADGSVYFAVRSDDDYGKLSGRRVEEQEAGTRDDLQSAGKRDPADFALWKAARPGEPSWPSPWGGGRPGWHIECSAMAMKYLGPTLDLHGGGMDLMFPHHENELAQSESATGVPFARYWLHNGLTRLKTKDRGSEKMSGSVGNVVPAKQLIDTHGADLLRYLVLSTHYRRPIEFTDEALENAKKGLGAFTRLNVRLAKLDATYATATPPPASVAALRDKYFATLDDDFNTGGAVGVLHELVTAINAMIDASGVENGVENGVESGTSAADAGQPLAAAADVFRDLVGLLGLTLRPPPAAAATDHLSDQLMTVLIDLRNDARERRDFATADAIRDRLRALGVTLEDRPGGRTEWRRP